MIIEQIKEFYLLRHEDVSGNSGTGIVARGVILPSGKAVLEWLGTHCSVTVYNNFHDVELIHSHEGKTQVVLGPPPRPKAPRKKQK